MSTFFLGFIITENYLKHGDLIMPMNSEKQGRELISDLCHGYPAIDRIVQLREGMDDDVGIARYYIAHYVDGSHQYFNTYVDHPITELQERNYDIWLDTLSPEESELYNISPRVQEMLRRAFMANSKMGNEAEEWEED